MTDIEKLREDVAYVRAAAKRSDTDIVPCRSIYLLWAVIGLCGFTLMDFAPEPWWVNTYWFIFAPVGMVLSYWFAKREVLQLGQGDRRMGIRAMYHWIAFIVAGLLGGLLVAGGHLSGPGLGSLWVLLLALSYFQAGLHFDRRLIPVGIMIGIGFAVTIYVPVYGWTAVGIILAAGLTVQAFMGIRSQDAAH